MIPCQTADADLCIYKEWQVNNNGTCTDMIGTYNREHGILSPGLLSHCLLISSDGEDALPCTNSSLSHNCKTLGYLLQLGDKSICILGDFDDANENIPKQVHHLGNIIIIGITSTFSLKGYSFLVDSNSGDQTGSLIFENLTIEDCTFYISDRKLVFIGCNLRNILIEGYSQGTQVSITLERSIIVCSNYKKMSATPLLFRKLIAKFHFSKSELIDCEMNFYVTDLIFTIDGSNISNCQISITIASFVRSPTIIRLTNTGFNDSSLSSVIREEYISQDHRSYINIVDCIFTKTKVKVWSFSVLAITSTEFKSSFRQGNGGAILIEAHSVESEVIIVQCVFEQNMAKKGGMVYVNSGLGGAVFLEGHTGAYINLLVHNCTFKNNFADDNGATLYLGRLASLSLLQCTFLYEINLKSPPFKTIVHSVGTITTFQGDIIIRNTEAQNYVENFEILQTDKVNTLNVSIECPPWYVHNLDLNEQVKVNPFSGIGHKEMKELQYQCLPCSEGYYTISSHKQIHMHIYPQEKNSKTQQVNTKACIKCPYGASCSGNNVVPRQNFWGYWYEGQLSFQACPVGYCCSGNDKAPCDRFNTCAGNRTGALCGACQENFSVSVLTGRCTPNTKCQSDRWFWFIFLLMAITYTLWYTFKDEVFGFIVTISKILGTQCQKKPVKIESEQIRYEERDISVSSTEVKQQNISVTDFKSSEGIQGEHIDKGYFGIVTYFVQMSGIMAIHIEFSEIDKTKSFLDTITESLGKFLGIQFSELSIDACPIIGLTTAGKNAFKFIFLSSIYVCWLVLFKSGNIIMNFTEKRQMNLTGNIQKSFKLKMIRGFIEIMKYTYCGFCEIIFMSLVCIKLGSEYVWWYDATTVCLENWQLLMVILGLIYAAPFPLALLTLMKMLKAKHISAWQFILCLLCQPIALYHIIKHTCSKHQNAKDSPPNKLMADEARAIISVLQGPYREDAKSMTLYWEAMVSLRRLLITVMALIGTASIRMIFITGFCIIFAMHHVYTVPFKAKQSNHVESLSLFLLSLVAVINLLKASLTDSGVVPSGPSVSFFKGLEFFEDTLLVILMIFIVFTEIRQKKMKSRISAEGQDIAWGYNIDDQGT